MDVTEHGGFALTRALSRGDRRQLWAALADASMDTAKAAAAALDPVVARSAVEPLLDVLLQDDEADLDEEDAERASMAHINAALALGRIHDPRAVDALLHVLATGEQSLRWYVIDALGMIADPRATGPLIEALGHPDIDMRKAASSALASIGKPAVSPLIQALRTSDAHYLAPRALGSIGDLGAVPSLIDVLHDSQRPEAMRYWCAVALGQLTYPAAFDLLIQVLHNVSESHLMRKAAVVGLGYLKDRRAVGFLLALTATDLCRPAVEALGRIGDVRAVDSLILLLRTQPQVSDVAAQALGAIGDPRALPYLRQLLRDLSDDTVVLLR